MLAERIAYLQRMGARLVGEHGPELVLNDVNRTVIALTRLALIGRTYKRDDDGRFGSGSGGGDTTPTEGGILPEALTGLTTVGAVNDAAKAEARRITGRDTEFALEGDHHVAAEHAAAILHGMSEFPGTQVDRVHTGDFDDGGAGAYAMTSKDGHTITFARDAQSNARGGPDGYRADLAKDQAARHLVVGSPAGVALHEFGHAVANGGGMNHHVAAQARDYAEGVLHSEHFGATVSQQISRRAATGDREMIAEGFAAVAWHGDKASGLSHEIVDSMRMAAELGPMDAATRTVSALTRPATLLDRTYTRDDRGRFGHGTGGGVRESLEQAKTVREIADVTAGELKTILGNDVTVNLNGLDPETARVHMEGVLRAAEFHPVGRDELTSIGTMPEKELTAAAGQQVVAITVRSSIVFSQGYDVARLRSSQELADAFVGGEGGRYMAGERGDLSRIGSHEYGHIAMRGDAVRAATNKVLADAIRNPGETPKAFVGRTISQYGATKMNELMAEAFSDVVSAGSGASDTSRAIVAAALPSAPRSRAAGLVARTYKRDDHGRFGSGSGGVRESLAAAGDTEAVAAVAEREMTKITGHFVAVSFTGMSPDVARETAEGVLRCAEAYPTTRISRIETYGPGGDEAVHPADPTGGECFAISRLGGFSQRADEISFNVTQAEPAYRASIKAAHDAGFLVPSDPMGVAIHEYGHIVGHTTGGNGVAGIIAEDHARAAGTTTKAHVGTTLGRYAARTVDELQAESFASVMLHGDKAPALAKDVMHAVERQYDGDARRYGTQGYPAARTYKRDKDGRFGSGSGGGEVREALADAKTLGQINDAAVVEARRITGRDVEFAMAHSDPQIAREHVEGVLRGLERFPSAPLARVDDYAPGDHSVGIQGTLTIAHTVMAADGMGTIRFNGIYSGSPARYDRELRGKGDEADGFFAAPSPMGNAMHEFGHVLTLRPKLSSPPRVPARKIATDLIRESGIKGGFKKAVREEISAYATSGSHELAAESVAMVLSRGRQASPVAMAIYRSVEALYPDSVPLSLAVGTLRGRTYKRDKDGRFGSGGTGVRDVLMDAETLDVVCAVAEMEAFRITGRGIDHPSGKITFDFKESDVGVAREHIEGVLRGLEAFPGAPLRKVGEYQPDDPTWGGAFAGGAIAFANMGNTQGSIMFNTRFSADPAGYTRMLHDAAADGHFTDPTVIGTAMHEFGHILTLRPRNAGPPLVPSRTIASAMAREVPGRGVKSYTRDQISGYATASSHELTAEAVSDVFAHGDAAAPVSHAIYERVEALYPPGKMPPSPYGRALAALSRTGLSILTTRGRVNV